MSSDVFSVHTITDRDNLTFDKAEYSRFKYGSKSIARKFGRELGVSLFDYIERAYDLGDGQIVVAPSPYMFIPTASFALKNYMISSLNDLLVEKGSKVVQETKVFRQTGYTSDYGQMSKEERTTIISAESFHTDKEFLKDKFVIFLDDVRITGAHQQRMEEMMERLELWRYASDILFVYYAQLTDPDSDPSIEDHLNYFSVKSLLDIKDIVQNDEFIFNTRNVKYILGAPHLECVNFMEYQSRVFIESLYHWAIGNSYHLEPKFSLNFVYLKHLINRNK